MNLKTIVSACIIALFFTGIACAESFYQDRVNGFSVHYPENWQAQDLSTSSNLIKANFNKDHQSGAQLRVEEIGTVSKQRFIALNSTQFVSDMENHWKGTMRRLEQGELVGSREPCTFISYLFKRPDGTNYFFKHYIWKNRSRVYYIQSGTPESERGHIEPLIDRMARSLLFF